MKNILYFIYGFPYVFVSMLCLWNEESNFMTLMFFVTLLLPVLLAYVAAKKDQKSILIKGNILSFVLSLAGTLILNSVNLVDELGGTWRGHFKPFYAEQFVLFVTIVIIILQMALFNLGKTKE